ncbi:MAG: hypothetical protein AAGN66_25660 [Acidobacteriota bacterium]
MSPTLNAPRILFAVLLLSLLACAVFADGTPEPNAAAEAVADLSAEPAAELPNSTPMTPAAPAVADPGAQNATPMSSGNWTFYGRESCYDLFERSCYRAFLPAPRCPSNPAGQACSPFGSRCFNIISSYWVDEYYCY